MKGINKHLFIVDIEVDVEEVPQSEQGSKLKSFEQRTGVSRFSGAFGSGFRRRKIGSGKERKRSEFE